MQLVGNIHTTLVEIAAQRRQIRVPLFCLFSDDHETFSVASAIRLSDFAML